ncbi:MAG: hypothetical protein U9O83_03520, partial [Campylobacterota bacterium]|nr:hypothetical protein [Campylobacterota bacterium]
MATDIAELAISIRTNDIIRARTELDRLEKQGYKTEKSTDKITKSFNLFSASTIATTAAVYGLSRAFNKTLSDGMAYNKQIEQSKAGLIALSVAVQDKTIPVLERYNKATLESTATMKELQKINVQTPHTLDQTNKIYKAMYASMRNAGASTADMVEMTRSLSIASGAAGIEFNSLLAGVDGLASGTVLANSDLGRFLSSLGLTNKTLKESKDVVETVTESLKDFKALGTISEATSNLDNAWSQLTGKMTEGTFDGAKTGLNSLSEIINNLEEDDIKSLQLGMNNFALVGVESVGFISKAFIGLSSTISTAGTALADVMLWMSEWDGDYDEMSKNLWKTQDQSLTTNQKLVNGINKAIEATKKSIRESEKEKTVTQEKYDLYEKGITKAIELTEKQLKTQEKQAKLNEKLRKTYDSIVGTKYEIWANKTSDAMIEMAKSTDLSIEALMKYHEVLMESAPLTNEEEKANDLLLKETELREKNLDIMNEFIESQRKSTEAAIESGRQFEKNRAILIKNGDIEVENNDKKESSLSNQATATAGLASAVAAGMKAETAGQMAAKKALEVTAVVAGGIAILTQGKGDPYSALARMAAMAVSVASILSSSGVESSPVTLSSNSAVTGSETFNELNKNIETAEYVKFDDFQEGLDSATDALKEFENVGSAVSKSLDSIDRYIAQIESNKDKYSSAATGDIGLGGFDSIYSIMDGVIYETEDLLAWVELFEMDLKNLQEAKETILRDSLSDSLDFSRFTIDEIKNIIPKDFNLDAYENVLDEINNLALKAKQSIATEVDFERLEELQRVGGIWEIGQDYADAL